MPGPMLTPPGPLAEKSWQPPSSVLDSPANKIPNCRSEARISRTPSVGKLRDTA